MKTAVEWLEEQVIKFHNWKLNPVFDENCFDEIELRKAIQQAKEMEREQKIAFAKLHVQKALKAVENEMILSASAVKHWYLPETIK